MYFSLPKMASLPEVTNGPSVQQARKMNHDYRVKVVIETANLTNLRLQNPMVTVCGGVITLDPTSVEPFTKEAMVIDF